MKNFFDSYNFIDNHPAFIGLINSGVSSLDIRIHKCCKNNVVEHSIVHVCRSNKKYKDFEGKGFKEDLFPDRDMSEFDEIWVPYEEYYGYKWSFDHVEIWIEGGAHYYSEKHPLKWERTHDIDLDTGGKSYEEAIISFSKLVENKYGDYSKSEFDKNTVIPSWIIENNKIHKLFPENNKDLFKNGKMNINPKNIHLKPEEINAIWWNIYNKDKEFPIINIERYLNKSNYELNKKEP